MTTWAMYFQALWHMGRVYLVCHGLVDPRTNRPVFPYHDLPGRAAPRRFKQLFKFHIGRGRVRLVSVFSCRSLWALRWYYESAVAYGKKEFSYVAFAFTEVGRRAQVERLIEALESTMRWFEHTVRVERKWMCAGIGFPIKVAVLAGPQ